MMNNKKNVMTSIDAELHKKAQRAQLSISALLENAIEERLRMPEQKVFSLGRIEFDFEEKTMEGVKNELFINTIVKAKRCSGCSQIWFVNDNQGKWKICRECREKGLGDNLK